MVEHLGLSGFRLGNQGLIKDIKDITTNLLQLRFNLLTVFTDLSNVLVGALSLLLLLDARDNSPRCTSGTNNILVSNGQEIALVNGKFTAKLWFRSNISVVVPCKKGYP